MPEAPGAQGLEELRPDVCSVQPSAGRIQSSCNTRRALGVDATFLPLDSLSCENSHPDPNPVRQRLGAVWYSRRLWLDISRPRSVTCDWGMMTDSMLTGCVLGQIDWPLWALALSSVKWS